MMTLNDLCAHLLPPEEHLTFKTLIMGEHGITLVAAMTAPQTDRQSKRPFSPPHRRY
jgi:hypothetical protein